MMATKINTFVSETTFRFKSGLLANIFADFYWLKIFPRNSKLKMRKRSKNFCSSRPRELKGSDSLKTFNLRTQKIPVLNKILIIYWWNLNLFQQLKRLLKVFISMNGLLQTYTGWIWPTWELSVQHLTAKKTLRKVLLCLSKFWMSKLRKMNNNFGQYLESRNTRVRRAMDIWTF